MSPDPQPNADRSKRKKTKTTIRCRALEGLADSGTATALKQVRSMPRGPEREMVETSTITREWAMPSGDTFAIAPIARLLDRWLVGRSVIVDPFARNSRRGTITNDLSLATEADFHMDARAFLEHLEARGVMADAVLFDPPYSPRQVAETYQSVGREVGREDTQTARLYRECRDRIVKILRPGAVVISFGWNSCGFGTARGFVRRETALIAHGAAHNDTIVTVETYEPLEIA